MFGFDPVTILVSVVVILFLANVYSNRKQPRNLPPGPTPLPIIGNLHLLDIREPYKTMMEMSKKYGTVLTIHFGMGKAVVLCGYDTVKDALLNHGDEFSNRPKIPMFAKTTKDHGIIFSNGESWKAMRRFTISTLRDYGMGKKAIEDKINEEAQCLVQSLKSYGGKPFENLSILNAAVANIIISVILGHRFDYEDATILKLMGLINENIKLMGSRMIRLYQVFPTIIDMLPGPHKKIFENIGQMLEFIRITFTKQKKDLDVNDQRNLIDAYLVKQQEGKSESSQYFHNENLIALVNDLFVAGMETTTTTLRWAILLMMKYPEIQKKVQNEIDSVIGTAQPQAEHRKEMPYTDAVIHEIQRFADIVPEGAPHEATQDVTFRGYFIPKGTTIIPLLYSVLKDEAYFKKPYDFYPEHFLDEKGHFKKNEAFIPFLIGKRSCAGETLAKMELFLFFSNLLQNFTFKAPPNTELDLTPAHTATKGPKPYKTCAIMQMGSQMHYNLCWRMKTSCRPSQDICGEGETQLLSDVAFSNAEAEKEWKKNPPNFPPGPTPLPFIGNMHILNLKKPYETLHELSKKYGTVYTIQIGEEKMVVLCGYEMVKDALIDHAEEFSGRAAVPLFEAMTEGYGVIFGHGDSWKAMRRFALSALRDFGMGKKIIEEKIQEECNFLVEKFKTFKGEPFDNTMIINTAVANIIISILLSDRFDYEDPTLLRLVKIINENVKISGTPAAMLYNAFPSVLSWFPGWHTKAIKNAEEVKGFVRETFTAQRRILDVNDQRNLIDSFLVKQQEEKNGYFTNENLTMLVTDLFVAGMETTTTTLCWGILLMMKFPEIQKKVQNEIERVIGSSMPQAIHRKEMPYTDAVIHEVQRFGNIVPTNIPHCTTQDVRFRGFYLPKGTQVIPLLTSVLLDEAHFKKPKEFYPEHFLDAKGHFMKKDAFLPFSAGKRSCAGENLAKMELFLFFTKLLQNFTFQAPPGVEVDITPAVAFICFPLQHEICAIPRT
ncbi:uncharacterized protein PAF06_007394 [Gastrophryne carolinensis]